MSDNNSPTQEDLGSQPENLLGNTSQNMSEAEANTGIDNLVANMFGIGQEPTQESKEEPEVSEEATQSEESTEESVEEIDEDTPLEDSEGTEVEDSGVQGEIETVDYDQIKDIGLEIGGEIYTGSQLKSMLGNLKKSGEEARKADQAIKDLETREAAIKEQEAFLQQRQNAAVQSDQLVQMQSEARLIQAAIEKARSESDMYEVAVQKDKMDVLRGKYAKVKQEVDSVQQQQEAKAVKAAEEGLKKVGMGYLLEDSPQAKAWTDYANSKLSQQELRAVTMIPSLAEIVEKARKYDSAQKKGVKLKTSGKTLKPGVNKIKTNNTNTKKKEEYAKNPDRYFQDLAKDVLSI